MKCFAVVFGTGLLGIVILADRGQLPEWLGFYKRLPFGDAMGHFCLMGLFAFLSNMALYCATIRIFGWRILKGSFWVFVIVGIEELSQTLIPTRTFSLIDLGADVAGIVVLGRAACFFVGAGDEYRPPEGSP